MTTKYLTGLLVLPSLTLALLGGTSNFPQFVAGGGSSTSFKVHNLAGVPSAVELNLFSATGEPLDNVECRSSDTPARNFTLDPGETQTVTCNLDGDLTRGWARLSSQSHFLATEFLHISAGGKSLPLVGVLPSPTTSRLRIFGVNSQVRTGIAFDNPLDESTTLSLRFRDATGAVTPCEGSETKSLPIGPHQQDAQFLDELCDNLQSFEGIVEVTASPLPVSMLSLLQDTSTGTITTVAASPTIHSEIHSEHLLYGLPAGTPQTNDLLMRDIYALSSNDDTKFADWVAYRLTLETISGDTQTTRNYKADPWLDEDETLEPSDYDGANAALGTDRSHQAPLASFKGTKSWHKTNFLSNITPQKSDLNQGVWRVLEEKVRSLVETRDAVEQGAAVYVLTGPLYERAMERLPGADEPHRIPSGYWKIVLIGGDPITIQAASFIFDQETPRSFSVIEALSTINEVERRSGLDFLWQLEDEVEEEIESGRFEEWARGWVE